MGWPSKSKIIIFLGIIAILIAGICIYIIKFPGKATVGDTDSAKLYAKDLSIGNTQLHLVVNKITYHSKDNGDWLYGEYQFYSTSTDSKPLITVSSQQLLGLVQKVWYNAVSTS